MNVQDCSDYSIDLAKQAVGRQVAYKFPRVPAANALNQAGTSERPACYEITHQRATTLSSPSAVDFALQGRSASVWAARPDRCIKCAGRSIAVKEWQRRPLYDVSDAKCLIFIKYRCSAEDCKATFSNIDDAYLKSLPKHLAHDFPAYRPLKNGVEDDAFSSSHSLITKAFAASIVDSVQNGTSAEAVSKAANTSYRQKYWASRLQYLEYTKSRRQHFGPAGPSPAFPAYSNQEAEQQARADPGSTVTSESQEQWVLSYGGKEISGAAVRALTLRLASSRYEADKAFLQNQTGEQLSIDFTPALATRVRTAAGERSRTTIAIVCQEDHLITGIYDLPALEPYRDLQPDLVGLQGRHVELNGRGPRMAYVDNVQNAKNLLPEVLPDLGTGLAPLDDGSPDVGIRQDLLHLHEMITDLLPTSPGLQSAAEEFRKKVCKACLVPLEPAHSEFLATLKTPEERKLAAAGGSWLRSRVPHRVPARRVVAQSLLEALLSSMGIFDPSTGLPLVTAPLLDMMLRQIDIVLENRISDPEYGLDFFKVVPSPPENGQQRITYMRETNIVEAVNRPLEAMLPLNCGTAYGKALFQLWTTGYNLKAGILRLQWTDAGCTDLPLLLEARKLEIGLGMPDPLPHLSLKPVVTPERLVFDPPLTPNHAVPVVRRRASAALAAAQQPVVPQSLPLQTDELERSLADLRRLANVKLAQPTLGDLSVLASLQGRSLEIPGVLQGLGRSRAATAFRVAYALFAQQGCGAAVQAHGALDDNICQQHDLHLGAGQLAARTTSTTAAMFPTAAASLAPPAAVGFEGLQMPPLFPTAAASSAPAASGAGAVQPGILRSSQPPPASGRSQNSTLGGLWTSLAMHAVLRTAGNSPNPALGSEDEGVATAMSQPAVAAAQREHWDSWSVFSGVQQSSGQGLGGKGNTRKCKDCTNAVGRFVPGLGHSKMCVETLLYAEKDAANFQHTRELYKQEMYRGMTKEMAKAKLAEKMDKSLKDKKRKRGKDLQ